VIDLDIKCSKVLKTVHLWRRSPLIIIWYYPHITRGVGEKENDGEILTLIK
jgi:hypothetical protein